MNKIKSIIIAIALILAVYILLNVSGTDTDISLSENSSFEVHYIDVGQADAALVMCDGKSMLIDGGNVADSNLIASYLRKMNIKYLDCIVCSHAHEDHAGGLSGALSVVNAGAVYAPKINAESVVYDIFVRKAAERNLTVTNPTHGDQINLGSSTVRFLGPINENTDNINNTSLVIKITYGNTSFLFTGDAETEEEQDIVNAGYDLSADVLKVGHHGSSGSTSYVFLRAAAPKYAVISVGADNAFGHPSKSVLSRLRDADVRVYRTDLQGDIIAKSDGNTVTVTPKRGKNAETIPSEDPQSSYIGNKNSNKFHKPSCDLLPSEQNRVYFSSRAEAVENHFEPCQWCNP